MRVNIVSFAAFLATIVPMQAHAQQNSREQARIYNQQSGPRDRRDGDWRTYIKYDYNHLENGHRYYYANRYYRDARYYKSFVMTRSDRIYRGSDHLYYCRRADGTTGRVVGLVGHSYGDVLALGGSDLVGTIAKRVGAALSKEVDRGELICR